MPRKPRSARPRTTARAAPPVHYRVRIPHPGRHVVEVEVRFPAVPGTADPVLKLPVWSPGSYLVREYARHVSGVRARDGRGRSLPVEKAGKNRWRVRGGAGQPLRVSYTVYAFERSVRTSHVTSDHAFLAGPSLFLYRDELRYRRARLAVEPPRGFAVACVLPRSGAAFVAEDYDALADSPIDCGRHRALAFAVAGTPFRVVFCGAGNEDRRRLKRDLPRIAAAAHGLFGSFPFASYLAIVNLTAGSRGGLEHAASTALEWPRHGFRPEEKYEDFLALFSHELFHAWNVKAAAPRAFRPYDYEKEALTRLLWWFEGITDYYDELLLRRAGLLTPRKYLDRVVDRLDKLLDTPGRLRTSVADASYDSWIKYYRPDEDTPNSTVSYYEKGHLVGLCLDLEVRRATRGQRSLDDVLRRVIERGREGLPEDGVLRAVLDTVGASHGARFRRWFARHVDGTEELPLEALLAQVVGLRLEPRDSTEPAKDARAPGAGKPRGAWLGAVLRTSGGRTLLATVLRGGPADAAGLSAADEIVALDGLRCDEAALQSRLEERAPGDRARLTFFRDDRLREVEVRLGRAPVRRRAVADPGASPRARAERGRWLGEGASALEA